MRPVLIPVLIASACLVTACSGSAGGGAARIDPVPAAALRPCRHPADFLPAGAMTQAQTEITLGRVGDELIRCGGEKAALGAWAQGVTEAMGRKDRQ